MGDHRARQSPVPFVFVLGAVLLSSAIVTAGLWLARVWHDGLSATALLAAAAAWFLGWACGFAAADQQPGDRDDT